MKSNRQRVSHVAGAASVARAWSGYIDSILGGVISNFTVENVGELHEQLLGRYPDFLAFAVCLCYTCVLGNIQDVNKVLFSWGGHSPLVVSCEGLLRSIKSSPPNLILNK